MGFDAHGHAIIGLRVKYTKLYEKVKARTFDHDYPEDWAFHPTTGKPLFKECCQPKAPFKSERLGEHGQFPIKSVRLTNSDRHVENDYVYVILRSTYSNTHRNLGYPDGTGRMNPAPFMPTPEELEAFKEACQRAEIWDESQFGLWADVS